MPTESTLTGSMLVAAWSRPMRPALLPCFRRPGSPCRLVSLWEVASLHQVTAESGGKTGCDPLSPIRLL